MCTCIIIIFKRKKAINLRGKGRAIAGDGRRRHGRGWKERREEKKSYN